MGTIGAPLGPLFDIPDFTLSGALPPYLGIDPTISAFMSPYPTSLTRIAGKLCGSNERRDIFRGLLAFRQQLDALGLIVGFQWLSGSFTEDIESIEGRHPKDVDVVTFYNRPAHLLGDDPAWMALINANLTLFDPAQAKLGYKCDPYFVDLGSPSWNIVDQTRYWFGLFSHRRSGLWKGLLQVPLNVTQDDADASAAVGP